MTLKVFMFRNNWILLLVTALLFSATLQAKNIDAKLRASVSSPSSEGRKEFGDKSVPRGIWEYIYTDQYGVKEGAVSKQLESYYVNNSEQAYRAEFLDSGVKLSLQSPSTPSVEPLLIRLSGVGYGDDIVLPSVQEIKQDKDDVARVNYHRDKGVTEWYINKPEGIEQGVTLERRLSQETTEPLSLNFTLNKAWNASMATGGESLKLTNGDQTLSYSKLKVWDSHGADVQAKMIVLNEHTISLVVNDQQAVYPLTIDPLIQNEYFKFSNGGGDHVDRDGNVLDLSDETIVIGIRSSNASAPESGGAVFIFNFNSVSDEWEFSRKLTALDSDPLDFFGMSVAISGDLIAVGIGFDDSNGTDAGAVNIYERNTGGPNNWGESKKIFANDGIAGDNFGASLSLDGDMLVVGSPKSDGRRLDTGAAYIYRRGLGGVDNWGQVKKMLASDGNTIDRFGGNVDVSGSTVVVGARYADEPGLGTNIGAVYVYEENFGGANNWGRVAKLVDTLTPANNDLFAHSVAIHQDTIVVGAPADKLPGGVPLDGSTFIFERDQDGIDNWGLAKRLVGNTNVASSFGAGVDIINDTIAVGAGRDPGGVTNSGTIGAGAVYVYSRDFGGANNWGLVKQVLMNDITPDSQFGCVSHGAGVFVSNCVALTSDRLLVGAPAKDTIIGENGGAVYVFERDLGGDDNWAQRQKIIPRATRNTGDRFGYAVSVSSERVAVGAFGDDERGFDAGAVFVFARDEIVFVRDETLPPNWSFEKKIIPLDAQPGDFFGRSVSLHNDTLAVGAYRNNDNGANSGSAYVYQRDVNGDWAQIQQILASDGAAGDFFGQSVSLQNDILVVGAFFDSDNGVKSGSAYVYNRDLGGRDNWGEVKKVIASDGAANDLFGISASVFGNTIVIGANAGYEGLTPGVAYVYERNEGGSNNWGEVKKLIPSNGRAGDAFGFAVSGFDDTIAVSAYLSNENGSQSGSIYLFERNLGSPNNWGESLHLIPSDNQADDRFGRSLSLFENTLVVGAFRDDDQGQDAGSAYVFVRDSDALNQWNETKKLFASDAQVNDRFGRSVAVMGDTIIVGADLDDNKIAGIDAGSAYVFSLPVSVLSVRFGSRDLLPGDTTNARASRFDIKFSSPLFNPVGDGRFFDDVTDPTHYRLILPGADGVIESNVDNGCLLGLQGDDESLPVNRVSYSRANKIAVIDVNDGQPLAFGHYSLLVCGSTEPSSIKNLSREPLDGNRDALPGDDFVLDFTVGDTEDFCFPLSSPNNRLAMICL